MGKVDFDNTNVIYSDDPNAIEKLQSKLEKLEQDRTKIKSREHETWELQNIGATIRTTKDRIKELTEIKEMDFKDTYFENGKVVHNKEMGRVQIFFDEKPDKDVCQLLGKDYSFNFSYRNDAWQTKFTKNGLYRTRRALADSKIQETLGQEIAPPEISEQEHGDTNTQVSNTNNDMEME